MDQTLGPVEYLIVAFKGNQFRGEIVPALGELLDSGMIRILDLTIISKDEDGNVILVEANELSDEVSQALARLEGEHDALLAEEDLLMAAEELDNNTTAAALLFENVWAARFAQSIRNAGGEVVMNVRIPHETVVAVRDTLLAISS